VGEVELPYVVVTTTIEDALQVMRVHDRSGVVTGLPNRHFVLTDEDLIDALRDRGNIAIGDVTPRHRTVRAPSPPHATRSLTFRDETPRRKLFEMMEKADAQFSVAAGTALSVEVLTISESLSTALGSRQILCRCRTNPQHLWRPAQLAQPGKCNKDGDPVDCN
jgi:CBS domain-containing protein